MRDPEPLQRATQLIASVGLGNLTSPTGAHVVGDGDELTPTEAARILGVSASTVRRYEDRGYLAPTRRLPGSGHRRYRRADVVELKRKIDAGELDNPEGTP
jgi:excisionase family DNA binding protein